MISKSVVVVLLLTVVCRITAFSQSFAGYGYDNYAGVNSMILNPSSIADSRYKVNVNIFSISALTGNNAYEMDRSRLFSLKFSHMNEGEGFYKSSNTANKYFYTNVDILGPSATISLTPKDAIGITTRLRVIGNEYNLGDQLFRLTGEANPNFYNMNVENASLQVKANAFAEAGLTYARVLWRDEKSEFKLGVTGKYVIGLGYASMASGPLQIEIDPTNQILNLQGDVTAQYSANLDNAGSGASLSNIINKNAGKGFGFDLGFTYEVKGADPAIEKFRFGLAVTDIGSINYANSANSKQYTLTATGDNTQDFAKLSGESFNDYFNRLQSTGMVTSKGTAPLTKVSLPTALHLNLDYEIYKRLYINGDVLLNMESASNPMAPNYVTTFMVTPRLEKKWVSVYSPVSYSANGQLNWGAGVRVGPFFVGSGSVLSSLMKQRIQAADAHMGLTIPIFQHTSSKDKKPTLADTVYRDKKLVDDRDGDGVVDSKDQCPDSAGPIPLFGCPDDDGDGVPNYKDKCPGVKGSPNFQGCPAPDTDGDSVNDDDDRCPLVKGVKSNFGCPPIKEEYINKVNRAADRVFFVRAKANIEPVSLNELDRVVEVLESDTTLRLRIEGYTDSEGPDAREIALSTRRAHSVYKYLVKKGIAPTRMDYIGYGKAKAGNETPEGMAQNRRVEMKLMNYPKKK